MHMAVVYMLKRNVGTVGRLPLACAVCNFSPSGHVLEARLGAELVPEHDQGLCNVHARGLAQHACVGEARLEEMRRDWLASR